MTKQEHLEVAKGCIMDVGFQHEKMEGVLAFMVQVEEINWPDHEETKTTLIVLQNLLGEARERLRNFDHHYRKYQNDDEKGG